MRDDRWLEVEDDFAASSRHFSNAVILFKRGGFSNEGIDGYSAGMSFMHAMQAGHTSLENGLRRILILLNEDLPSGESWHSDLIKRVSRSTSRRPSILSKETSNDADETRRFRNVAVRSYDSFLPQYAENAVKAAENLSHRVIPELRDFQNEVDGPESEGTE